jgi:hypothetical protein
MSLSRLAITGNLIRQLLELPKLVLKFIPPWTPPPSHPVDKRHDGQTRIEGAIDVFRVSTVARPGHSHIAGQNVG